ncbi:phosphoribosyltransferase [Kordiimonas lipolytica]|uniref:Phosphoribosyltransferase n=1 Tax=Kordiimonas lipolytica TaxID=1662421 RepID=A0ABV8U7U3_9PROT|nr:phosphoribosyltransferase [Kordiimonas lipolytica]
MKYRDRTEAGRALAAALVDYTDRQDVLILALPRGGVPIAREVADTLGLAFDIMLVRKLGVPGQEELAMGAISVGGLCVLNEHIIGQLHLSEEVFDQVLTKEQAELARRNESYRGGRPAPKLDNRTVILVDDGLATGATMQVAVAACKKMHAREIIAAVPVGAVDSCAQLARQVDRLVCPFKPDPFWGVGHWYGDFSQVSDEEVQAAMAERCMKHKRSA